MSQLDFAAIKEIAAANHTRLFDFLGLQMKRTHADQYRGPDPHCGRGGDRILVYTISKQRWACHSDVCSPKDADGKAKKTKGGDLIYLTAHVRGIGQLEAAKLLQQHFMRVETPAKPKRKSRAKPKPTPSVYDGAGGTEETEMWEAFISRL